MNIRELLGVTLSAIHFDSHKIDFVAADGRTWRMHHHQSCCEHVFVESVVGNLADLLSASILVAEESSSGKLPDKPINEVIADLVVNAPNEDPNEESQTWTFYKLATRKGYVDIRWYGSSNGYYSESVDFERIN